MTILLILLGIAILILLEELLEYWYRKKTNANVYRFRHMPKQLDICNVGSGPGFYGITYEDYPLTGFNMSTAPQSFFYGYKILKHYSKKIKKGAIIIIIMCPLSFGNNQDYHKKGYDDTYYGLVPAKEIEHFSIRRAFLLSHPLMMNVLRKLLHFVKGNKNRTHLQSRKPEQRSEPEIISGWKREFQLQDLKNAEQSKDHKEAFAEKIKVLSEEIEFCYRKNWRPVLVTPPVPGSIREYISDEFADRFVYKNIYELLRRFPNLQLLDYYKDDRFTEEKFQSAVFMNEIGRKDFSKILFNDIAEIMGNEKQDAGSATIN